MNRPDAAALLARFSRLSDGDRAAILAQLSAAERGQLTRLLRPSAPGAARPPVCSKALARDLEALLAQAAALAPSTRASLERLLARGPQSYG